MRPCALLLLASLPLAAAGPAAAARVEIILDVSGSMRASLGAETKMAAARKAIRTTLDGIQPGSVIALRLYGHRVPQENKAESCKDTELAFPFQAVDKAAFQAIVDGAQPRGQTPLTYSLEQAAHDFGPASDEQRTIILVSDGEETCGGDPAAAARSLLAQGFKLKVHTIGFDVDAAARAQLEAISTATGGEYHDARNAAALSESLTRLAQQGLLVAKESEVSGVAIRGGNGHESAAALQPGQVYHLDHHQRKDQFDYFYVEARDGQKLVATIETTDTGVEIRGDSYKETGQPYAGLTLQSPSRQQLGHEDVIGRRTDKKGVQVSIGSGQGGRYFLLIGSGYSDQHKDSRFQVSVEDISDAGSSRDAGSAPGEAVEIKPGSVKGFLHVNDTVDFFKFRADSKATYTLRVRPSSAEKWLEISVTDADGVVIKEGESPNGGAVAQADGLRFAKGGEAYVRVANHHLKSSTADVESEYSLELTESGGTQAAAQGGGAASPAPVGAAAEAGATGGRSFLQALTSLVIWSGIPLVVGFLVGAIVGFVLGRRRR
jgi:Ca-activated chloride channel family protein